MGYNNILKGSMQGYSGRNTIYDILSLSPEERKAKYTATNIHKVIIDNDTYTNYGDFQFGWEKAYPESPERSARGVIDNLDSHVTFVTPRLILKFDIMSIDDFRSLMRKDLSKNEFVVTCYDPIYDTITTNKMYFATAELAKLHKIANIRFNSTTQEWEDWVELVGVDDYTVELIGTNADISTVTINYYLNAPIGAVSDNAYNSYSTDNLTVGDDIVLGEDAKAIVNETFGGAYRFTKWNISAENPTEPKATGNYIDGTVINIPPHGLKLYAQWEASDNHTLTFNYGLADPAINEESYEYETSRMVVEGQSIGTLPTANPPSVKIGDTTYYPYENGEWWKVPVKAKKYDENGNDITDTLKVYNNEPYWKNKSATIYLLFDVKSYNLALLISNGSKFERYSTEQKPYNSTISLPYLVRVGYKFDGWYTDQNFQNKIPTGTAMPPYNLILFARWIT